MFFKIFRTRVEIISLHLSEIILIFRLYPGKFLKFIQSEWYMQNAESLTANQKPGNLKRKERTLYPVGISLKREKEKIKQISKVSTVDNIQLIKRYN